ncbi:MAG: hypothetical protein ACXVCN_18765, partial [Bdellovibrio sp.]
APRYFLLAIIGLVYSLTLFFNDGIMALDEYFVGITRYIPAQTSTINNLVHEDDVKSPLQIMPMYILAKTALNLGLEHPYSQYRFVIAVLGFIHILILGFVFYYYEADDDERLQKVLLTLLAIYFVAPFAFTRPMFESLAAPWIALSAHLASKYDRKQNLSIILMATVTISIAFILRQQIGILALGVGIVPLLHKKFKHFFVVALLGLGLFILAGIPDIFLRGSFHHSLLSIFTYNVAHGADYGRQSVLTYPLLIFALCFGPWWIMKYPTRFWKNHFRKYRVEWIMVSLFVLLHSSFPQKWERFLISIIPLLMILMAPLVMYLFENRKSRPGRWYSLVIINYLLFMIASFFPPQKNIITLSLFLDDHPEVQRLIKVNNFPEWITEAFIRNKNYSEVGITESDLKGFLPNDKNDLLIVPEFLKGQVNKEYWKETKTLPVNFIETISYKLNPKANKRRVPIVIFTSENR